MFASNKSAAPSSSKLFVEDVFSTWLYTSTGSNQTINNGIDLAGKGGMVLFKGRSGSGATYGWGVFDTNRGVNKGLRTNDTSASFTDTTSLTSFNSNGFGIGIDNNVYVANAFNGGGSASWTFRKAPKFFDVVTYTGDGTAARNIAHNLGSRPHCVIIKRTDTTENWKVGFRDGALNFYQLQLNTNDAANTATTYTGGYGYGIASGANVNTHFTVEAYGGSVSAVNASGATYVAYLFAHDATSDGIIQCGSFTTTGGNQDVSLGWEPQWLLLKRTNAVDPWMIVDTMRGFSRSSDKTLEPNSTSVEYENGSSSVFLSPTATGFTSQGYFPSGQTYIYIAIRRGPMRTPTSGTSVFAPITYTGDGTSSQNISSGITTDFAITHNRNLGYGWPVEDRLRGNSRVMWFHSTDSEYNLTSWFPNDSMSQQTGYKVGSNLTNSGNPYISYSFRRAPSFFDVVCYTGTGTAQTLNHNLGVAPEFMIVKLRSAASSWITYSASIGNAGNMQLNANFQNYNTNGFWNSTSPTSTQFTVSGQAETGASGSTYVAYLFASCPGVSKVGSYTGNGTTQTIDCGFTAGARFVLIKRTDSTGDWYVWDTARGMTALTDPYLLMNSTAAETSTLGAVTTTSVGFSVNASVLAAINTSGANYIFLAVA